jgi:hypothetical protein
MNLSKRFLTLTVVSLALIAPSAALADTPPASVQATALSDAVAYWASQGQHLPADCPMPTIGYTQLDPSVGGEAAIGACEIAINSAITWAQPGGSWDYLCHAMTHEVGHLILGGDYFAATNPSDPAHSADPNSVMFEGPQSYAASVPACSNLQAAPVAKPVAKPAVRRHRHHRRLRFWRPIPRW